MQTLASTVKINGTLLAIHQLKITVYRCTVSQHCSSPCRCNLSMKSCPRAPTMFWLIVPVSSGHLGLPVILHITHICPNKRHTVTEGMRTLRYTEVCTLQVHIAHTDLQTWSPAHTKTHKEKMLPMPIASYVKAIHAQTVRQRSKVFITIDVRLHNKKWWLNLLQSVLFKAKFLSPSCCSLSSLRKGDCDD